MSLLREQDRQYLIDEFNDLQQPVNLMLFSQEFECMYCRETREIATEVAGLWGSTRSHVAGQIAGSGKQE